ncbi:restriction endonuclease subunit S, partial [Duncaniella sp.]|uniref:restriction endonuclease subunit S n=1 Tax=Duncaniella sp. TaxID=2518496 RepID=UPI0023C505AA|nr:restriction endonuclease subunit S [Duncaniella sp.]
MPSPNTDTSHYRNFTPPFEIPDSWEWVRLGELLENRDAERVPISSAIRKKQTNKIYDYYGAAGVIDKVDDFLFSERLLLVGEDGANLLSRNKDNAFFAEGKYWVNNHAHILDCHIKCVLDYVAIVINSYNLEPYITGSAQPKLSQDNLIKIPIPLPPLAEQHRILKTIDEATKCIDTIVSNKSILEDLISYTKSKILDLAMQGKLVQQDPTDEPAADMLLRINPKAKIITDNPHYPQLPDNWAIVPLED